MEKQYFQFCKSPGAKACFWSSYVNIMDLVFQLMRSTLEANWRFHTECLLKMVPWFCAYDRSNYERCLPLYFVYMLQVSTTHSAAYAHLKAGEFTSIPMTTNLDTSHRTR